MFRWGFLLFALLPFFFGNLSATEISFTHDPISRRIEKRADGIRTKGWLWSGALRIAAELDGANAVTARFIYAGGANVPTHMVRGPDTFRLITDIRGSVRLVVNTQTGTVAQRLDYDEFGRVTRDTNPGFQPFGFAGGLYDPDTALVRFGARDYDAQTARWTVKDPLRFAGGSPDFYAYAANDPVHRIDVTGARPRVVRRGSIEGQLVRQGDKLVVIGPDGFPIAYLDLPEDADAASDEEENERRRARKLAANDGCPVAGTLNIHGQTIPVEIHGLPSGDEPARGFGRGGLRLSNIPVYPNSTELFPVVTAQNLISYGRNATLTSERGDVFKLGGARVRDFGARSLIIDFPASGGAGGVEP